MDPVEIDSETAAAIAAGVLDPRAATERYTNGQMAAQFFPIPTSEEGTSLTEIVLELREEEGEKEQTSSSGMPEPEQTAEGPSFKELLRMPPYADDFPDASELRAELPQANELGLDE